MGIDDKYPFNLYTSPFTSTFTKTEEKMVFMNHILKVVS